MLEGMARHVLVNLLILISSVSVGYYRGYVGAERKCLVARTASIQRAYQQGANIAKQDAEVSANFEQVRTKIVVQYQTVEKEIVHEIPVDCSVCRISPDGIRMLNDAIRGDFTIPSTSPRKSSQPMRSPRAIARWRLPGNGADGGKVVSEPVRVLG